MNAQFINEQANETFGFQIVTSFKYNSVILSQCFFVNKSPLIIF
jgi:hypothetical protein